MENGTQNKSLYFQMVDLLKNRIDTEMKPHDKLPSERELTTTYGVSRTTVRLALAELENEGYIYRQHGKGTFVSDLSDKANDLAGAYSFTEQMQQLGRKPLTKVLTFQRIEADKTIASQLQLNLGEVVIHLRRLRTADGEPLMVEDTYLPSKYFLALTETMVQEQPLYDLFSNEFQQTIRVADEEFFASIATEADGELLHIPEGAPVLNLVRKAYNMKNELIEYTISVARADQFHYKIRHVRN